MRARMLAALALVCLAPAVASAQNFSGAYVMNLPTGGVITITLRQDATGHATGTMSGNGNTINLDARLKNKNLVGRATSAQGALYFEAALEGGEIEVVFADLAANGQADFQNAKQLIFERQGDAPPAAAAAPSARAPTARTAPAPAPQNTDQVSQQLTQLLTSSNWCSFSYNSTSGRTSTSKNTFRPDGWLQIGTNSEGGTMNSQGGTTVAGGSFYSQQQGGGQAQWRVQGGQLYVDMRQGAGWQLLPLDITRNSNGYPIIKANGTEYSQCN